MKNRWKIFWIVCGAVGGLGIAFCLVGLCLGATFSGLKEVYDWPYVERTSDFSVDASEYYDEDGYYDYDEEEYHEEALYEDHAHHSVSGESNDGYTGIRELDVEVGRAAVVIREFEGAGIQVDGSQLNSRQNFQCKQDGEELKIEVMGDRSEVSPNEGTVYIYVPRDSTFAEVSLEVGAGILEIETMKASSVDIAVGAGEVIAERVQANELSVECDAGVVELSGKVEREADFTCGIGSMTLTLDGKQSDFNYELECGVGSIQLGDSDYSGLYREQVVNNRQDRKIDVECGVGSIEIDFRG